MYCKQVITSRVAKSAACRPRAAGAAATSRSPQPPPKAPPRGRFPCRDPGRIFDTIALCFVPDSISNRVFNVFFTYRQKKYMKKILTGERNVLIFSTS